MKVLQPEHAGRSTGPNIVVFTDGRAAAAIRRFAAVPQEPECRDVHHTFNRAQAVLAV
jgi:hypothetical protein